MQLECKKLLEEMRRAAEVILELLTEGTGRI